MNAERQGLMDRWASLYEAAADRAARAETRAFNAESRVWELEKRVKELEALVADWRRVQMAKNQM